LELFLLKSGVLLGAESLSEISSSPDDPPSKLLLLLSPSEVSVRAGDKDTRPAASLGDGLYFLVEARCAEDCFVSFMHMMGMMIMGVYGWMWINKRSMHLGSRRLRDGMCDETSEPRVARAA